MKIRTRITLQFSIIVSVILIAFALSIYYFVSDNREEEFYSRLKNKALTAVKLFSDVDEVDNKLLKIFHDNTVNSSPEEWISIYDNKGKVVYSNKPENASLNPEFLKRIKKEKEIRYQESGVEVIALLFDGKLAEYIAVAKSYDAFGLEKLNYLRYILIIVVFVAILVTIVVGLFFSRQALNPISNVVNQIDKITISNLDLRVDEGNGSDEIAQLAIKFNKMLERLDSAFEIQRGFVANASHELRTPLTAITGQLEVALMNEKVNDPLGVLRGLLNEIKQLNKLSNGLLDLAQANLDVSEIKLRELRIDELLGLARAELLKRNKNYNVQLNFSDYPEESWLKISANEQLLKSALTNVMDNACKYSNDHTVQVELRFTETNIELNFADNGIGISPTDLKNIFEPFFRSPNAKAYSGHGIGLTLARKIIELHKGTIHISSELGKGTRVSISLPHL